MSVLVKGPVKKYRGRGEGWGVGGGGRWAGAERGGSWGVEPYARGGSCNFQLPLGGGLPYFIT